MTKNEVIETIRTWMQTIDDEYDIEEQGRVYGLMEALELVKQIEPEQKWIPVSEGLPEKNVEVLATTEWGAVTIAEMYSANDWFIHEGTTNAEIDEIVAWMPLPKPYEPQERRNHERNN